MTKDEYKVIKNPMRWYRHFEVWCSGESQDFSSGHLFTYKSTRCIAAFRTRQKAENTILYWQEVAEFRDSTV